MLKLHAKWILQQPTPYFTGLQQALQAHRFRIFHALRRFEQALRLAEIAQQDNVEHLHAHFASVPATVCSIAAKILNISYSISAHAHDIWTQRPLRPVIEGASVCLVCTAQGCDYLAQQYPSANVHLLRHGVALTDFPNASIRSIPPRPLRIVAGGRLVAKKGFDVLIDACAILMQRGMDFRCDIYGDGELESELKKQILEKKIRSRVKLHPFLSHEEFRQQLAQSHICVIPCRVDTASGDRDGIPNVLLEAAAAGTLLVTSNLSSLCEFVRDGETGFLFEADNADSLADVIEKTVEVANTWSVYANKARERLKNEFDPHANIARLVNLIEGRRL